MALKAYGRLLVDARPLRDLSMLHAIVKVGTYFIVGLLLSLLWTGAAYAQTATPTLLPPATPTPTTVPTASPTPGPTPTPGAGGSTVFWWCTLRPGQAPVCTWSDYGDSDWAVTYAGPGTGTTYAPGPLEADWVYVRMLPPDDTKSIVAECSHTHNIQVWKRNAGATVGNTYSYFTSIAGVTVSSDDGDQQFWTNVSTPASGFSVGTILETQTYTWTLNGGIASWPAAGTFPAGYANQGSYVGFGVRATAGTSGSLNEVDSGSRAACEITKVIRLDGSDYVPTIPVVGGDATPTPVLEGGSPWPTPVSWIPGNPSLIMTGTLGVSPGGTTCHQMLPTFHADGVTVFGYTVGAMDVPEFELCLEEHSMALNFMGWDYGVLVVAIAALGMGGAFYGLMRMG